MKKPITKKKVSISLNNNVYEFLENEFENKSQYIENLIYEDMKNNNLIKKEIIL